MHLGSTSNWVVFQKQNTTNQQRNQQQILVIKNILTWARRCMEGRSVGQGREWY